MNAADELERMAERFEALSAEAGERSATKTPGGFPSFNMYAAVAESKWVDAAAMLRARAAELRGGSR